MRRSTVLGLVAIVLVLVIAAGAYTAFWWVAAGKIEEEANKWVQIGAEQQIEVSWTKLRVTGFPLGFHAEAHDVLFRRMGAPPAVELLVPYLSASIRPWNLHALTLAAPAGLSAALGPPDVPFARLAAEHGSGAVAFDGDGRITIWVSLNEAKGGAGIDVSARTLDAWAILPGGAPASHRDPGLGFAVALRELTPPVAPPGLKPTIDELGFGVTMRGAFPSGPLAQAAAKWRDDGGTVELDHLDLRWGDMQVTGSGTLALDSDLQPVGALSGGVSGFGQLLTALVAAGRIKAGDARMARLALAMLAKPGADGRPEIATSLSIQNGEMFLGPVKLGKAPRIDW